MNARYIFHIFILFFSVSLYLPLYTGEYPNIKITFLDPGHCAFTYYSKEPKAYDNFSHHDFPHDDAWDSPSIGSSHHHQPHFKTYAASEFHDYFTARKYTEQEVLNQRCLYMYDEFVKCAQTYPNYKSTIQQLHVELKKLNRLQKFGRIFTGTYCRGLQKRIQFLYNQLSTFKTTTQSPNNNYTFNNNSLILLNPSSAPHEPIIVKEHSFETFHQYRSEYKALSDVYHTYTPSLSTAIDKRIDAFNDMTKGDYALQYASKSYNLNNNVKQLIDKYGHDTTRFTQCSGHQLQHALHQEALHLLERIDTLSSHSVFYDQQEALIDFTVAMADYNHAGLTDKAMDIGNLCWTFLDYGQAIAEGAALGAYSAVTDILTHPIEATINIVAGKQVLAYQLSKVLYNVADIGITALSNLDHAKDKWNKYAEPLNNIIDAIDKKEITVRDAIKGGTAFVVGYKAQGKLLGGLGKFCNTIKQKSINFVKNSSLTNPREYFTTPEGLLFKSTINSNKFQQSGPFNSISNLKNIEKLTGTVWKSIKPTGKMYPGTKIPKSFELTIGKEKFWVSPNATKHMKDYITKGIPAYTMPIDSQILLTTFEAAVKQAIAKGIVWKNEIIINSWQFGFDLPKKEGLLPTIYHANFNPEGWLPNKNYSKIIPK